MTKRAVEQLRQLLEAERGALLAGDLETVHGFAAQKEELILQFESGDTQALADVSSALKRNGILLAAAQDGVAKVVQTLRQQREARQRLSTYDRSGKATTITARARSTERRF